jgi:hypothetical protein
MSDGEPVRLVLTAEQRELIHRVSGQHVEALEIDPDDHRSDTGLLRFLWRRSEATGIPRQKWVRDDESSPPQANA